MATAYPEPEKGGRGQKGKVDLPFSKMLLSQARVVLPYPDLRGKVMAARRANK
jgi:hypothetical protein